MTGKEGRKEGKRGLQDPRIVELNRLSDRYERIEERELSELGSVGILLRHKKSGARVALLLNEDENKVFSIGFRTPPEDSTGVAHIVEHTVLCGSERFPVKDPFVELAKGSLNTFLNAMTFPDKTMYPVASCNDKDFANLMHVYLDAVFFPDIYRKKEIFLQEGWHYELSPGEDREDWAGSEDREDRAGSEDREDRAGREGREDRAGSEDREDRAGSEGMTARSGGVDQEERLTVNGVVYNEMKGALSSPEDLIYGKISEALFPETTYRQESGGDPDHIPELSYEDFLEFHRRYYHPSNSYIYLYGDLDAAERLEFLDREYLSRFERQEVDSEIALQAAVSADREFTYPAGEEGEWLSYNVVAGRSTDLLLATALQILGYVLVDRPGAPVKQVLTDAGIGQDIRCSFNAELRQPVFSVLVKNAAPGRKEDFVRILMDTLTRLAEQGVGEKSLAAAINFAEFRYREADFGSYPKGLIYGMQMLAGWLYEESAAFTLLEQGEVFQKLREEAGNGFFEELIRTYLLDNPHHAFVCLKPDARQNEKLEAARAERLERVLAGMSGAERETLRQEQELLKRFQEEPSLKEDLEKIPMLAISDIGRKTQPLMLREDEAAGILMLHHDIFTSGIAYIRLLFDATAIPEQKIPYLALLSTALGYVDSEHMSYGEFTEEMLLATGGITTDMALFSRKNDADGFSSYMEVKARVLYAQIGRAFELIEEMLLHTTFGDGKRMREILAETVSRMQLRMESSGSATAVTRGLSYVSGSGRYKDEIRGIAQYRFLKDLLEHFEERREELFSSLNDVAKTLFTAKNLLVSVTAENEGYEQVKAQIPEFAGKLFTGSKGAGSAGAGENGRGSKGAICADAEDSEGSKGAVRAGAGESGCRQGTGRVQVLQPIKKNEVFCTSGQVQFAARVGNFTKEGLAYTGALKVLSTILNYDYLWNHLRVQGGAYGCSASFGLDGDSYFVSYRDPNLAATDQIYEKIPEYCRGFAVSERDMVKYIIGTISAIDTPLNPGAKGGKALAAYLKGITEEDYQRQRDEILSTGEEEIRGLAKFVEAILRAGCRCALASEGKIREEAAAIRQTGTECPSEEAAAIRQTRTECPSEEAAAIRQTGTECPSEEAAAIRQTGTESPSEEAGYLYDRVESLVSGLAYTR